MFEKHTYKIKWSCNNPEVLQRTLARWRKRGYKSCCIEYDDNGRMWLVLYVETRFKSLSRLLARMVEGLLRFQYNRLEEEEGWQDEKNYI